MSDNLKKEGLLQTWKEIAAYLDLDVRTCSRWEKKYGLPIHRLKESDKSMVFAYKEELDKWLSEKSAVQESSLKRFRWRKIFYFLFPIIGGLVFMYFLLINPFSLSQHDDFKIKKSNLIILNEKGKKLWQYDTKIENLESEERYRKHFQFKKKDEDSQISRPYLIIKDINQDAKKEVLFSIQTQNEFNEGKLFCFNHDGRIMWEFDAGRKRRFGQIDYSSDYRIGGFVVCDLDFDGDLEIIMTSMHNPDFPCQLVVLNAEGKLLGEYWNSGYLTDFNFIDLNEDGRNEVIVSGQNNEYKKACLVVFDLNQIKGGSPQIRDNFRCDELELGSEKYYILLPRTDIDMLESPQSEAIASTNILKNKQIELLTHVGNIYFVFDYNLAPQAVRLSHYFEKRHIVARREKRIKSRLDEAYKENLVKGILYYDGKKWISHHAMSNPWKD